MVWVKTVKCANIAIYKKTGLSLPLVQDLCHTESKHCCSVTVDDH